MGAATIAVLGGGCSGISVLSIVLWQATLLLSTRALPSSPVITSVPDSFVNRNGNFNRDLPSMLFKVPAAMSSSGQYWPGIILYITAAAVRALAPPAATPMSCGTKTVALSRLSLQNTNSGQDGMP